MSIFYKNLLIYLLPVAALSLLIHSFIITRYFSGVEFNYTITILYTVIFLITTVNLIGINFVNKIWKDKTGFAFMVLGMIKMFLVIFLIVKLRVSNVPNIFGDGINIAIIYLVSLIPEVLVSIKVLSGKEL
ncbi:MAG: hypothetical protein KAH10_04890 [Flavobacteriales bacterium]|nr:hypothetical protein [Flavobacteriales bacterium]